MCPTYGFPEHLVGNSANLLFDMELALFNGDLTIIQFGFPTAHKLTFLSSPPVTNTLPDLCPRETQLTLAPWATNSSEIWMSKLKFGEKLLILLNEIYI